jgi:hypothetical protein
LELIADAFGSGTVQLAGDANETFTIADGAANDARSFYLVVTSAGSLTATRTVTLAPNTVNKVWLIKNSTTGGQAIEISQGSGANVTIANGETKAVYGDGAGSGAAVTDYLAGLVIGGAFGVEGAVTLESTLDVTGQTTLANLTATGTINFSGATVSDGGTVTTIDIDGGTVDGVVIGGSSAAAGTFTDLTASGTVDFSGATVSIDGGTIDGVVLGGSTPAAATVTDLTATGTVTLPASTVASTDAGAAVGPILTLYRNSASPADDDVIGAVNFSGENDAAQQVTYARVGAQIKDATDATEDGALVFYTMGGGTFAEAGQFQEDKTLLLENGVRWEATKHYTLTAARTYSPSTSAQGLFDISTTAGHSCFRATVYFVDANFPNGTIVWELYVVARGSGATLTAVSLVQEDKARIASGSLTNYGTWSASITGGSSTIIRLSHQGTASSGSGDLYIKVDGAEIEGPISDV